MKRFLRELWNQLRSPWTLTLAAIYSVVLSVWPMDRYLAKNGNWGEITFTYAPLLGALWIFLIFNLTFASIKHSNFMEQMRQGSSTKAMLHGYVFEALPRLLVFVGVSNLAFISWAAMVSSRNFFSNRWLDAMGFEPFCGARVSCDALPSPSTFVLLYAVTALAQGTFYWFALAFFSARGVTDDQLKLVASGLVLWPLLLGVATNGNPSMVLWLSPWMTDPVYSWQIIGRADAGIWFFIYLSIFLISLNFGLQFRLRSSTRDFFLLYYAVFAFVLGSLIATVPLEGDPLELAILTPFGGQGRELTAAGWASSLGLLALFVIPSSMAGKTSRSLGRMLLRVLSVNLIGYSAIWIAFLWINRNPVHDLRLLFTGELFVVLLVGLLQCFVYSLLARVIPFGGSLYLAMMAILVLVASALRPNFPYTPVGMEAQNLILTYPKNSPIVEIGILLVVILVLVAIDQAQKFRKVKV